MTTSPPPLPPAVLAQRYRLERRLAQGGMAEVWLGTDLSLSRQVAIKLLKPNLASDPVVAERFRREAIAVAQLNHPNIVAVYDAIEDGGRQAVVMQLVDGKSLRQLLDEQKKLSPELTIHIGSCVASALDAAHQAGMVHRDVKPGNILITPDGRVLLTDFGIAKGLEPTGDDLTHDNIMMGTAKYLSPEQVRGKRLDGRADLYSLGLVLYECLAGRVPFLGQNDADTALARLQRDPTDITRLRPTLPRGLPELIHRLLARRPDQRYASGAAVKAALAEIASRAHETALLDTTASGSAPRPTPIDPTLRKPYDQAATHPMPTHDPPVPEPGRRPAAGGSNGAAGAAAAAGGPGGPSARAAGTGPRTGPPPARPPAPVRTGGRPAGAPVVRADRDRTPTGSAPVVRRPNRRYEHRRGPSLIVVGSLLLVALVVGLVLWNTIGTDTGGDEFPDPTGIPDGASGAPAPGATTPEVASAAPPGATTVTIAGEQPSGDSPAAAESDDTDDRGVNAIMILTAFDPDGGDGGDGGDGSDGAATERVALATDGRADTTWTTGCHEDPDLGGRTVGLAATMLATAPGLLSVDLVASSWAIEIYASVAPLPPATLAEWGEPIGRQTGTAPITYELQVTGPAKQVLVVIRQAGPNATCGTDKPYAGEIAELHFAARP